MTITTAVITAFAFALLPAAYLYRSMFLPTRGRRIDPARSHAKALLVLDIQESGTAPDIPLPLHTPLGRMIAAVNRLIDAFDRPGCEVAYVRQVFRHSWISRLHGGRIVAGRLEPRLCRWLTVINDNDFAKDRTDAFSNRALEKFLMDRQVGDLYLVGLDAAFCVYFTACGAVNRGYRVTVVSDAVMTGRDMDRVLERFRRRGIAVISSTELCSTLESARHDYAGGMP